MLSAVFFDLDETLIDADGCHREASRRAFAAFGMDWDAALTRTGPFFGRRMREILGGETTKEGESPGRTPEHDTTRSGALQGFRNVGTTVPWVPPRFTPGCTTNAQCGPGNVCGPLGEVCTCVTGSPGGDCNTACCSGFCCPSRKTCVTPTTCGCAAGAAVSHDADALREAVQRDEVEFEIGLPGSGAETEVFFSDLSPGYVAVNAEYTT